MPIRFRPVLNVISTIVVLMSWIESRAGFELKTSILPSVAVIQKAEVVFDSHTTILVGPEGLLFGPYIGFETLSSNHQDLLTGAATRVGGENLFFELQGGVLTRSISQGGTKTVGKGYGGNVLIGTHFNKYVGLSALIFYRRVTSGLDKSTQTGIIPLFSFRAVF